MPRGRRKRRFLRPLLWIAVAAAAAWLGWRHRSALAKSAGLMAHARPGWLLLALVAICIVYLCRATVYYLPLRLLGYTVPRAFLYGTALVATSMYQLFPAAGATGYAYLTYALNQRGVSAGQASLIAIIDTLSYAAVLAPVVVASLAYLAVSGAIDLPRFALTFIAGIVLVAGAGYAYALQRNQRRFAPLILRLKHRVEKLLDRSWPDAPVRAFLDEYYRGKAIILRRPRTFLSMVALQSLSIGCDTATVYLSCLALGIAPRIWIVFMGFVVSMAGLAIAGAPAGGGSFEVIMSAFFVSHGFREDQGIAVALVYRLLAFWLPVLVSLVLLLRLRRRTREIRRRRRAEVS